MKDLIIQQTGDLSHTLFSQHYQAAYHSTHGAIQESQYVFIKHGLHSFYNENPLLEGSIRIFEMGFGTGLNLMLTFLWMQSHSSKCFYQAIEKHPISVETIDQLNYHQLVPNWDKDIFQKIHQSPWDKPNHFDDFEYYKSLGDVQSVQLQGPFHIIYYDAFGPRAQPELWEKEVLSKVVKALLPNGFFVTYCSQSAFRRTLSSLGVEVKKYPGPPGKREMVVGRKI